MSGELPAGEGTRMRIGFEGKDCAAAVPVNTARTHARNCFIGEPFCLECSRGIIEQSPNVGAPGAEPPGDLAIVRNPAIAAIGTRRICQVTRTLFVSQA